VKRKQDGNPSAWGQRWFGGRREKKNTLVRWEKKEQRLERKELGNYPRGDDECLVSGGHSNKKKAPSLLALKKQQTGGSM